ncbi:hypothetical protein Patl1_00258 [Pistacia atlantica]|uniref:Uncharacterized protein n=1 Tax=Pistacia atlantica TaxID=434234 RepID=A0ACC1C6F0_9ROSI|nr:hypothetical protein Patl1_00258 [Pistacia atlantica]
MKLVWSPETASKAYIDTVKSCENFKESSVAELLSAMAAGWNAKLIVEAWSCGGPIATSIGLAVAARHTSARHVCVVPDERSRLAYVKGHVRIRHISNRSDSKRSRRGDGGTGGSCGSSNISGLRWNVVLERGLRVVRSVLLPVGQGLDMAHVGSNVRGENLKKSPTRSRWIKHIDQRSGALNLHSSRLQASPMAGILV